MLESIEGAGLRVIFKNGEMRDTDSLIEDGNASAH